ncbi:MAG: family 43 glycosylhydrolase [Clostridia bacterium]|nr:family 43 glycosylhydrolase [Clostridia bacterium]
MSIKTVRNPYPLTDLWDGREIGDPFLMRHDGRFYLYCSSHSHLPGVKCWVSEDMIHFDYQGFVCTDERTIGAYAPEVAYNAGKFWMVTSPRGSGHYLLRSDSPLGPFEVVSDNLGNGIDGSIFVDDDGRSWFYRSSHQGIRVHAMPTPGEIDVRNRPIEASWLGHWTEGPQVIKRDGRYFLTDTGNHVCCRGYHVDYTVSREGADHGYRRLRDGMLLLETRDEYHALGHSSTCVGPDMDTMYIVYHKNVIGEYNNPLYRSLCMDRLSFNGDRMYTNATWWDQKTHRQPVCVSRGGEGLEDGLLPVEAGATYTAEINVRLTEEKGVVCFSGVTLTLGKDRSWALSTGENGTFPGNVATDAPITIKVSLHKGLLVLFVNGMEFLRRQTSLGGGAIGVGQGCAPSFVGFSDNAQGAWEGEEHKPVPGAFDAVHGDRAAETVEGETGCRALVMAPGETAGYVLNVWKTRKYHLAMTVKATDAPITLTVNGQTMTAQPTGAATEDGMEKRWFGVIGLHAGVQAMSISAQERVVIDRIYITEADELIPAVIIDKGEDVTNGVLHVIGHKQKGSMHRKFCGYTAAEGYGEAWYGGRGWNGENWRDMAVHAVINWKPCAPEAHVGIYLRSNRETWHPHQVAAGRMAYALQIAEQGIRLCKQEYNETILAEAPLKMNWGDQLKLTFRVQGSRITVEGENGLLLAYTDPMPLTAGRVGISASTDGLGFESLEVCEV